MKEKQSSRTRLALKIVSLAIVACLCAVAALSLDATASTLEGARLLRLKTFHNGKICSKATRTVCFAALVDSPCLCCCSHACATLDGCSRCCQYSL
jgi:hypothetical protein